MRIYLFLKISILVFALVGVVFAIQNLNSESMHKVFAALGIEPGTKTSPGLQPANRKAARGQERMNICPTRVHAIVWKDGRKVEEVRRGLKLRWVAIEPQAREINYMAVEKWLSAHCQIHIESASMAGASFDDSITIQYIDGTEARLLRSGDALFSVNNQVFRSEDFRDALEELKEIAQF